MDLTQTPVAWISNTCFCFSSLIINTSLLTIELKKRRQNDILHISKYIKVFPLITMILGVLTALFGMIAYLPGFCYFGGAFGAIALVPLQISLGYYQLSRLYYCFSNKQTHSKNGYSKNLFIAMFSFGPLYFICGLYIGFSLLNRDCGLDKKYNYQAVYLYSERYIYFLSGTGSFLYSIWDFITLGLYVNKIRIYNYKIKKKNLDIQENEIYINIHKRISYVLSRITILTILYELPIIIVVAVNVLYSVELLSEVIYLIIVSFAINLMFILMTYSTFLMQEHNSSNYDGFLKKLIKYRVYYALCCWKSLIIDSLEFKLKDVILKVNKGNNTYDDGTNNNSVYDTRNISETDNKLSAMHQTNLSMETTTYNVDIELK